VAIGRPNSFTQNEGVSSLFMFKKRLPAVPETKNSYDYAAAKTPGAKQEGGLRSRNTALIIICFLELRRAMFK